MSAISAAVSPGRKRGSPLLYFLGAVMAIFIGILIFVYIVTKQTNPVFLDEHGKPLASQSAHHAEHGR